MKTALCVSGKWTGYDYTHLLREIIPHDDFYVATYTGIDCGAYFYMDEPEFDYNPLSIDPYPDAESRGRRDALKINSDEPIYRYIRHASSHWAKQILIHNHVMKNIDADIVIRARFETVVSNQIDWNAMIEKSWEEEIPLGFNTRSVASNLFHHRIENNDRQASFFINDALIIHPQKIWDCDLVDRLYKEQKLRGAEEGWYQILSEPHHYYHVSYDGGAYSAKDWKLIQDVDASLHNNTSR